VPNAPAAKPNCSEGSFFEKKQQPPPPFYGHYTGQPALTRTSSYELEDFVGAKSYCPHALADSCQHIQIREKTLSFSSAMLPTLSPCLLLEKV